MILSDRLRDMWLIVWDESSVKSSWISCQVKWQLLRWLFPIFYKILNEPCTAWQFF